MRTSVVGMARRVALVAVVSMVGTTVAADAGGAAGTGDRAVAWEVVDLGFGPQGVYSTATAINDRGVVVGFSSSFEDGTTGYLWRRGRVVDLGSYEPSDVNSRGVVVGSTVGEGGAIGGAAIWRNGRMTVLTGIPGYFNRAEAINDRGQVVGIHPNGTGGLQGYVWHRGRVRDLAPVGPTDDQTVAEDIDEDGTAVGYSCGGGICRPARWPNGVGEYLPLPSGALAGGAAAVDEGRVVGTAGFREGADDRNQAVEWDSGGRLRQLDVPGAGSTVATGLAGRFVSGWALSLVGNTGYAVAWRDGVAHILPTRHPTDSARAEDVDARGRVVGMIEATAQPPVDPPPRAVLWRAAP